MKTVFSVVLALVVLGGLSGCNSGTVKGVGSDVERIGAGMQK